MKSGIARFNCTVARLFLSAILALGGSYTVWAQVDATVNLNVWKFTYGLTDAQVNSASWMAADDDGDGLSNGAELAAGTNPLKATSTIKVTSMSVSGQSVLLTVRTMNGKRYLAQSTQTLGDLNSWTFYNLGTNPLSQVTGDGLSKTLTVPLTAGAFYRVLVQDIDTDGDQISDWAEKMLGYDPTNASSNGTDNDHAAVIGALATTNIVSIASTDPTATQPPTATATATDSGMITVSRSGTLLFSSVTVPLVKSGTAVEGLDYTLNPFIPVTSVTIPANSQSATITVAPLLNNSLRTNATATLKLAPAGGFTIGTKDSASVVIYPSGVAAGTGLRGTYFNRSSTSGITTYNANLFSGTPVLDRTDAKVDVLASSGSPGPGVNVDYYTVRWDGQVQPQYSEPYYFAVKADDGFRLWVNGQLLIDKWPNTSTGTEWIGTIPLQAGVLYDLRMDYYEVTGSAEAHLSWFSESQVKQIIPTNRLYPSSITAAPTAITSALSAIGFINQPFTFNVTASNSANFSTTYALGANSAPLPTGLNLNAATGVISGTPTVAGDFQVALIATNSLGVGSSVLNIQILNPGNKITREIWTSGIPAGKLIPDDTVANPPAVDLQLTSPEDNTDYPIDNTGERLRGYITAPATGNYYFWIAANNAAELWISNDAEPVNNLRRATVAAPGAGIRQWSAQTSQKSPWLSLVAGQKYYFEVLHNKGFGTSADNLALGWFMDPTGTSNAIVNGSGLIPGYVFSPYDYPSTVAAAGVLYATNMAPQGSAASSASGSANLRLNKPGEPNYPQAILHFQYTGLGSPRIAYHIHSDQYGSKPSQINFDIDDVDQFHPELRTADGGYIWNIVPTGTLSVAEQVDTIQTGKAYINIHSVNYPNGEIRGNFGLVIGSQAPPVVVQDPGYSDDHGNNAGAARFLNQAAFGASPTDVAYVNANGFAVWIDNQFSLLPSHVVPDVLANVSTDINALYPDTLMFNAWWKKAITAPDQLRQRVAFALSEILVVSDVGPLNNNGRILADFYDTLLDFAFLNFRDTLKQVTLTPAMGIYLDMRANQKGSLQTGLHPNENYAREVMQLFSIGLNRMWPDGSLVLDSQGNLVPTYRQPEILGLARVFTGWNYGQNLQSNGHLPTNFGPSTNYLDPMVLVPTKHELGSKQVLDNVVLPAATGYSLTGATPPANSQADSTSVSSFAFDNYCLQDLEKALDSIMANPNVGPYICRQLIQRLVTSSPSSGYLYRVVQKFNDDGSAQHVRGNMQAVIKGILLDSEARSRTISQTSTTFGKQREPLVRLAAPARTFPALGSTGTYTQPSSGITANYITISTANDFNAGATAFIDFDTGLALPLPVNNPTTTNYTVLTTSSSPPAAAPTASSFTIAATGMVNVTYTQPVGSYLLTVNTGGPPLPALVGGVQTYPQVYLSFLTVNGTETLPISGLFSVTTNPNSSSFTVNITDLPVSATVARSGRLLLPKMGSSYSVSTATQANGGMTTITVNSIGNHNLKADDHIWFDANSGVVNGVTDGEYIVSSIVDEDHFRIVKSIATPPANQSQNSNTIYPLVAPPLGRTGNMRFEASTFSIGKTDSDLTQTPLNSPTVFNFFFPDYKYPGSLATNGLTTPEFQLTTDTNVVNLTNTLAAAFIGSGTGNQNINGLCSYSNGGGKITMDLGDYMTPAYTSDAGIPGLVDILGDLLTGGQLTAATKTAIFNFVTGPATGTKNLPFTTTGAGSTATERRDRVRAVVHLIITSPEYAVQK